MSWVEMLSDTSTVYTFRVLVSLVIMFVLGFVAGFVNRRRN